MADLGEALDYEGEFEAKDEEFEVIPEGTYEFEVETVERGQYNGGAKMGPCPIANVRSRIVGGEYDGRVFFCNLYLNTRVSWKVKQFFVCVGLHPEDAPKEQKVKMDWSHAVGRRGHVKLGVREYNGREYTDVQEWLKPSSVQTVTSALVPGKF